MFVSNKCKSSPDFRWPEADQRHCRSDLTCGGGLVVADVCEFYQIESKMSWRQM